MGEQRSPTPRIGLVAGRDPGSAREIGRLTGLAIRALPQAYLAGTREFAFTVAAEDERSRGPAWRGPAACGRGTLPRARGTSLRYAVIAELGLRYAVRADQRSVLAGEDCGDLLGALAKNLDDLTSRGDVALLCWAAAEAGHSELPHALDRLRALDGRLALRGTSRMDDQLDVVSAAWIVTALVAARPRADVEQHLAAARARLLAARRAVFPHLIGGAQPWYRAHVGSFADQIYPVQALARLHASAGDPAALAAAEHVAGVICQAQGPAGQWWWHYDSRTGEVVEGYPVYSVHQHAMAPMALLDLAEAGGQCHLGAICAGLRWLAAPPETTEPLVTDDPPAIWRKVARGDRRKLVRGLRAAATAVRPGSRVPGIDRLFPPGAVDYECRPYELGWLLYAWLRGARS